MRNSQDDNPAVLFEVPDFALCLQLRQRLEGEWGARVVGRSESRFVSVPIASDDPRMELLLQEVAEWAAEAGLREVRFHAGERMSLVVASPGDV